MPQIGWTTSSRDGSCSVCTSDELHIDIDTGKLPNVHVLKISIGNGQIHMVVRLCRRHATELLTGVQAALSQIPKHII